MTGARQAAALAVAAILAFAVWAADPPAPLTNEDIVRMVASGAPEREILETIAARAEAFDTADDMLDELALAGVPANIRDAMRRKHAESVAPAGPPDRTAKGQARVSVTLAGGTLKAPVWADEDLKARLKLPKENDQREIKDLAVFLACVSPEHIPDLWRSKTPLGRDMVAAPRHEMLAFIAGDTPAGKKPQLTVPSRIEGDVDDSEPHDLLVGVAARIGDRWLVVAVSGIVRATPGPAFKPLAGKISRMGGDLHFKVELSPPR